MKRSLNLMSEQARKSEKYRRNTRMWLLVLAVLTVCLTFLGASQWNSCRVEKERQSLAESEYEPIRQLKIENSRLEKEIEQLRSAESIPLELAKHQPLLSLVGLTTQLVEEQKESLYLSQLEIERDPIQLATKRDSRLSVSLDGVALETGSATLLSNSLRKIGLFSKVEISTNKVLINGRPEQQAFSIQCAN